MITKWLDDGNAVNLICLDFSQAFDSVNDRLPLGNFRGYGIALTVTSWIERLLRRRTFQVNVNGTISQTTEAISDVPQCSVMGQYHLTYVNDLPYQLFAESLLYTDDVKLIAPRNRHGILQSSLNVSSSWSKGWELDLNPTKSEHLAMGYSPILSLAPSRPITHRTPTGSQNFSRVE